MNNKQVTAINEKIKEVRNLWIQWQGEEDSKDLTDETVLYLALNHYKEFLEDKKQSRP